MKVADYCSGSSLDHRDLLPLSHLLDYFSTWCGHSRRVLADIREATLPRPLKLQNTKGIEDYVAHLQDRKLAPNASPTT